MICEDKVKEYCRQVLFIEERYRKCKRCCLNCNEPCGNYCRWTLELKNRAIEGDIRENSSNVAEAIPFKSFKEKIMIVKEELKKGRYVEVWDKQKVIYSERKDKNGKI